MADKADRADKVDTKFLTELCLSSAVVENWSKVVYSCEFQQVTLYAVVSVYHRTPNLSSRLG